MNTTTVRAESAQTPSPHHDSPSTSSGRTEGVLLSAKNLSVRFGGVLAVNNVSFDVKQGEVFTLIGPNGAGKTTVFNLISRLYTPTTGSLDYEGQIGRASCRERV